MTRPTPTLAQKLRIGLWRAKVRAAKALGLPVDYRPPASVGRDHAAALALLWDGRWFLKTAAAHGEDDAVERNSEVRVSFARTEMKLLKQTVGVERARDLDDALRMVRGHAVTLMRPAGGLEYAQKKQPDGSVEATVHKCAAFEGAREAHRRGIIGRQDQACVHCVDVWKAWLGELLPDEDVHVTRGSYQGEGADRCEFRIRTGTAAGNRGN